MLMGRAEMGEGTETWDKRTGTQHVSNIGGGRRREHPGIVDLFLNIFDQAWAVQHVSNIGRGSWREHPGIANLFLNNLDRGWAVQFAVGGEPGVLLTAKCWNGPLLAPPRVNPTQQ